MFVSIVLYCIHAYLASLINGGFFVDYMVYTLAVQGFPAHDEHDVSGSEGATFLWHRRF